MDITSASGSGSGVAGPRSTPRGGQRVGSSGTGAAGGVGVGSGGGGSRGNGPQDIRVDDHTVFHVGTGVLSNSGARLSALQEEQLSNKQKAHLLLYAQGQGQGALQHTG